MATRVKYHKLSVNLDEVILGAPTRHPSEQENPEQVQWMPTPSAMPGCPPGLECLAQLDQIMIHQEVELLEALSCFETENRYQIKNALGQQVYFAFEKSEDSMRSYFKSIRGFTMHIVNNMNQEVLRVVRPFQCCAGCGWCADSCDDCALTISVETSAGEQIGHVRQRESNWKRNFDILDDNFEPVLKIRGPWCVFQTVCCTDDIDFHVNQCNEMTIDKWVLLPKGKLISSLCVSRQLPGLMTYDQSQEIGKISKQWGGFTRELFTKADNFAITFPVDLDVKVKGTLLAALFLIDFMYYEPKKT